MRRLTELLKLVGATTVVGTRGEELASEDNADRPAATSEEMSE